MVDKRCRRSELSGMLSAMTDSARGVEVRARLEDDRKLRHRAGVPGYPLSADRGRFHAHVRGRLSDVRAQFGDAVAIRS
jgi:hypothetical protein